MLPTRAYIDSALPIPGAARPHAEDRAVLIVVANRSEIERFPSSTFTRLSAHSTAEALALIERSRPRVVAVDWDADGVDGDQVVRSARRLPHAGVEVALEQPEHAPAAIRAGCHAV